MTRTCLSVILMIVSILLHCDILWYLRLDDLGTAANVLRVSESWQAHVVVLKGKMPQYFPSKLVH